MGHEARKAVLDLRLLDITVSCFRVPYSHLQLRDIFSSVVRHLHSLVYRGCGAFVSSEK